LPGPDALPPGTKGTSSARARVEAILARIGQANDAWHIFTRVTGDDARAAAAASDERARQGRRIGALDGACVAVKDNIDLEGHATTAGIAHYRDAVATADAQIVRRMRAAGAAIVGKTNMHEAALGATSDNPWFGRCENPRHPGYSPGGSSGGSAAAVAAGLSAFALGTDTMGSVRIPAAYCGVAGFKPTRGLLNMDGITPLSPTLDALGLFAPGAAELALAWQALSGESAEVTALELPRLRLGFLPGLLDVDVNELVARMYQDAVSRLRGAGVAIVPMDWPGWDAARLRQSAFVLSEIEGAQVHAAALEQDPGGFSPELRAMLAYGAKQAPEKASGIRAALAQAGARLLQTCAGLDAIVLPTTPGPVPRHGQATAANLADFTVPGNIAGLPCISIPWGETAARTPLALQLLAAPGKDAWLLGFARCIEGMRP
jgi:aspartyl-tRNA(Asn)/glutamyl-tRNA(Gln) amidotransferase subunit A